MGRRPEQEKMEEITSKMIEYLNILVDKKLVNSKSKAQSMIMAGQVRVNDKIDFDEVYPQWHVLHNYQNKDDSLKKQIMLLIRSLVKHADTNINYTLKDPFESIQNINDIKNNKEFLTTLKIIVSFIFNYCRSELGIVNEKILYTTMSEWILKMNSID